MIDLPYDIRSKCIYYINRSFRDVADSDYIAARATHRLGLSQQFLWCALQAVEKYLKSILLYNGQSAKNISHDINKAFERLKLIDDIQFDLPQDIGDFINYISSQGPNRYFEKPLQLEGKELLQLDRTVWYLRRYCQFIRDEITHEGKTIKLFRSKLKEISNSQLKAKPNKFLITGGHLEKVLKKKSRLREELIWKNFYYGTYTKKVIKDYTLSNQWAAPPNFTFPEAFPYLKTKILFSKEVIAHFENQSASNSAIER